MDTPPAAQYGNITPTETAMDTPTPADVAQEDWTCDVPRHDMTGHLADVPQACLGMVEPLHLIEVGSPFTFQTG